MSRRPCIKARKWAWKDDDRTVTPGIGIFNGTRLAAHLTSNEARKLADKLHDMADTIEPRKENH